jgi:hypothetical protein
MAVLLKRINAKHNLLSFFGVGKGAVWTVTHAVLQNNYATSVWKSEADFSSI